MDNKDDVIDFIHRRFPIDCHWLDGNCYYFALILKDRFIDSSPTILYDVINGHFVTEIGGVKYDWSGIVHEEGYYYYVKWSEFHQYDSFQRDRIMTGCRM